MNEKISDALTVDFKMHRERKRVHESGPDQFWIRVTATPTRDDVREIDIKMYQVSDDPELRYLYPRIPLLPYTMRNGHTYTWDYQDGDVIVVIVRYTLKTDRNHWFVAASGTWVCDGLYFMSGERLRDRSELFNDTLYLQHGDQSERDAIYDERQRVGEWAVQYWWNEHSQVAKIGYTSEEEGNYRTMLHIGDESAVLIIDKQMHILSVEYPVKFEVENEEEA